MTAAHFLRSNAAVLSDKTPYEQRFVTRVLARVGNLDWSAVRAQTPLVDPDGRQRYIDFTITEGDVVKIAIEVDGYDKTGQGSGMTRQQFVEWSLREQAIAAAGYRVIRVANALVDRDPQRCARTIERVLKCERELQARLHGLPAAQRPTAAHARERLADELLTPNEVTELRRHTELHAQAISELERRLRDEISRREHAELTRDGAREDRSGVLALARYFAFAVVGIAIAAVLAVIVVAGDDESRGSRVGARACNAADEWSRARRLVGQRVILRGPALAATYRRSSPGRPTFIDVGRRFPDPERLVVVVWGRDRDAFPVRPENAYTGKSIAVAGQVNEFRGVAQIQADAASDIVEC